MQYFLFICSYFFLPLSLPSTSLPGSLSTRLFWAGRLRETLGKRLPFLHASISFLPAFLWLSKQCVILVWFRILKVGERQTVLITEDAKDQAHFVGHNKFYDQVSHDWSPHVYLVFCCCCFLPFLHKPWNATPLFWSLFLVSSYNVDFGKNDTVRKRWRAASFTTKQSLTMPLVLKTKEVQINMNGFVLINWENVYIGLTNNRIKYGQDIFSVSSSSCSAFVVVVLVIEIVDRCRQHRSYS